MESLLEELFFHPFYADVSSWPYSATSPQHRMLPTNAHSELAVMVQMPHMIEGYEGDPAPKDI